jgi:hypothetical protein
VAHYLSLAIHMLRALFVLGRATARGIEFTSFRAV